MGAVRGVYLAPLAPLSLAAHERDCRRDCKARACEHVNNVSHATISVNRVIINSVNISASGIAASGVAPVELYPVELRQWSYPRPVYSQLASNH